MTKLIKAGFEAGFSTSTGGNDKPHEYAYILVLITKYMLIN